MNSSLPLLRLVAILVVAITLHPAARLVASILKVEEIADQRMLRFAKAGILSCTFITLFASAFAIIGDPISPAVLLVLLAFYSALEYLLPRSNF
jgi:hypothetical protein